MIRIKKAESLSIIISGLDVQKYTGILNEIISPLINTKILNHEVTIAITRFINRVKLYFIFPGKTNIPKEEIITPIKKINAFI